MAITSQAKPIDSKKNWKISNISSPTANTEITIPIPAAARHFMIRSRLGRFVQVAPVSGESGSNYIKRYGAYCQSFVKAGNLTSVYVQTPKDNDIIEVETWE